MPVSSVWTAERSQATTSSRSRRRRSKRAINGTRANRAMSPKATRVRPIWAGSTANMATSANGVEQRRAGDDARGGLHRGSGVVEETCWDAFSTSSSDRGESWSRNVRVSDRTMNQNEGYVLHLAYDLRGPHRRRLHRRGDLRRLVRLTLGPSRPAHRGRVPGIGDSRARGNRHPGGAARLLGDGRWAWSRGGGAGRPRRRCRAAQPRRTAGRSGIEVHRGRAGRHPGARPRWRLSPRAADRASPPESCD